MMNSQDTRRLYHLFAEIMDYPQHSLPEVAAECAWRLGDVCPDSGDAMQAFVALVEKERLGRMEEIYTRTFDITPTTTLYAGYHLFGESYKRGAFLVRLQEAYRDHGFNFGPELADHLAVLLGFVSVADDPEFVNPLLEECILPVLGKVEDALQGSKDGYGLAIASLRSFLRHQGFAELGIESRESSARGMGCPALNPLPSTLNPCTMGGMHDD